MQYWLRIKSARYFIYCKWWGFRGGDRDECRPLGYNNPVRTLQETYCFSVTEPSRLLLCKIWGFHGGDYKECSLLGCYAVWLLRWQLRLLVTANVVARSPILVSLWWRRNVPPKRRFLQEPSGITSQNTSFFILDVCGWGRIDLTELLIWENLLNSP
jgi:hypothetical protein